MFDKAKHFAQCLTRSGILAGDRVVLCGNNSLNLIATFFAIHFSKATPVVVDPSLPYTERLRLYKLSDCRLIVDSHSSEYNKDQLFNRQIPVLNPESEDLESFVGFSEFSTAPVTSDPDKEIALIVFTSGTTDQMKAVMLSHEAIVNGIENLAEASQHVINEIVLNPLPLFHIYPLMTLLKTLYKSDIYVTCHQLTPTLLRLSLQENQITTLMAVPRLLERMMITVMDGLEEKPQILKQLFMRTMQTPSFILKTISWPLRRLMKKKSLHTVQCLLSGGSDLSDQLFIFFNALNVPVLNGYGLSETGGAVTVNTDQQVKVGTVGKPFPNVSIKISSPDEDGIGEVLVKSPSLMRGYFRDSDATQNSYIDGHFKTGDLGKLDSEGFLKITGRIKELIVNPDGKKVLCSQLDEFYGGIPGVAELAAVGLPVNGNTNEMPHLAVVLTEYGNFSTVESALYNRAKSAPGHWKISGVHEVSELPKTPLQKVMRARLKRQLLDMIHRSSSYNQRELSPKEIEVQSIWQKILKISTQIPPDSPFMSIGGSSLAAAELYDQLQKKIGHNRIELSRFLEADTIGKQAKLLEESG